MTNATPPSTDPSWETPAERSGYRTTPDYAETLAFLGRLAEAYPRQLQLEAFGSTGEGRPLELAVLSKDGIFEPERIHASGRVVLLVQNSIHAGEMDGKDACLALTRDLLRRPEMAPLLDRVVLAFIPVYNVDGHERRSAFTRFNQNGPELAGWRANGTNLNLNRDYLKVDAPETRAFFRMFRRWLPDFFVDDHVTDGADFQYDVTFALDATPDVPPETADWIRTSVTPQLVRGIDAAGHRAFPGAVFLKDETDPAKGLAFNENPPRFSTGRMILENRPGLLVELHMLKDYRTRVTGNYALLRTLLELLHRDADRLLELNRRADAAASSMGRSRAPFPLIVGGTGAATPTPFAGVEFERYRSEVSGGTAVRFGSKPWDTVLPVEASARVVTSILPPVAYIVPPAWVHVLDVLSVHGVRMRITTTDWTGPVERYRLSGMRRPGRPFEGRYPILRSGSVESELGHFGTCTPVTETVTYRVGSAVVPLDQRLSKVAIHWLEPEAPDSAFRWGFFDAVMEQKESGEAYVLERYARERLDADPALRKEFEGRLATDAAFASDAGARLAFFFDRSPWGRENRVGEYPVGRLASLEGVPLA
ncbi:MAG TPA: M14 family metallopeptidase [Thermoplasmata archaeon]|nr:M14 family metallopeptidase [Thermoplasmata archaeon]